MFLQSHSSQRKIWMVLLALAWPILSWGAQTDTAPLPDEVVERLVHAPLATEVNTVPLRMQRILDEVSALLEQVAHLEQRTDLPGKAREQALAGHRVLLDGPRTALAAVREEVRAHMAATRTRLGALGVPEQVQAWDTLATQVEARFRRLDADLDAVRRRTQPAQRRQALETARATLHAMHEAVKARETALPLTPVPTFTQDVLIDNVTETTPAPDPAYLTATPSAAASLALSVTAAPGIPPEAAACGYTTDDLGQGATVQPDAQLTQEIRDLAAELGYDPLRIYEYVIETIRFEPYYGSLKGAAGALVSQAGNATDHASLLMALLRAANIPTRYIKGTVSFTNDPRLLRWLGAKDYPGAVNILAQGRVPNVAYNATQKIVQFPHVWVEACVPYENYRGRAVDNTGYRWIPLDASFKEPTYQAGISTSVAFDYAGYMARRTVLSPAERYAQQVETAIKSTNPNNTLQDVGYVGTPVPASLDLLPSSLPYEVIAFLAWGTGLTAEVAKLPEPHRYSFTLAVQKDTGVALAPTLTLKMPEVVLQRITLSFKGATSSAQTTLDAWKTDNNPNSALPCTVNVIPVIKAQGVDKLVGSSTNPVGLCTVSNRLILTLTLAELSAPAATINTVSYTNIRAANYHAIQAYAFQASDRLLSERAAALLQTVRSTPNPNTNQEATEGEFLHLVGLKYMRAITDGAKRLGELDGGSGASGNHLGLASSQMKVQYLFDLPFSVYRAGFLIDVPGGIIRNVNLTTGALVWKTFLLAGYHGSFFESAIWQENARLDAVSTVRGIQFARESGIQVLTLTAANWATEKVKLTSNTNSALNYAAAHVASIQTGFINQGYTLTIPRSLIQYQNWRGAVFVAEKNALPTSASAAFIINQYAGGYTVGGPTPLIANPAGPTPETGYTLDPATPSAVISTIPTRGPVNGTTLSNGSNVYITAAGDPVNLATGNFYHVERDLWLKGRGGLPLVFERSYNSRSPQDGPLGFGWTHSFHHFLRFYGVESSVVRMSWVDGTGGEKFFQLAGSSVPVSSTLSNGPGVFVVLRRATDGTYTLREKNGLTYTFESNAGTTAGQRAKLLKITDRNGNALTLGYNTSSQFASVTDGLNRALTFTYTGTRITELRDWTGRRHQYGYNTSGDLVSYKNPVAVAGTQPPVTYTYYTAADGANRNHALKRYTLPRGNGMTFEYYSNGKVFRHFTDLEETTTFTYNDFRRETVVVNPRGDARRVLFDSRGNPERIVEEHGGERVYTYDPAQPMNRLTRRDPLGYVTQYIYDANGNVTRITNPSGRTVEFSVFTAFHQPGKVKDVRGNYTLYKYDAKGNVLQELVLKSGVGAALNPTTYTPVAADLVAWTIHTYDSVGNRLSTKAVRDFATQTGPTLTVGYNDTVNGVAGLNAVTLTRRGDKDGDGVISTAEFDTATLTYDTLGRVTRGLTAAWYPTQVIYDAVDRVVRATDALGFLRDVTYDTNGNDVAERLTVTLNGVPTLVDQWGRSYDLADRPESTLDAGGFVTRYDYDAAGNVRQLTNPDNYTLHFTYDPMDRLLETTDPAGQRTIRTLDLAGKPRTVTDPTGHTTTYAYYDRTQEGRLKSVTTPAATGTRTTQYAYDAQGNVTQVTDPAGRTTLTSYDELHRPTRVVGPAYTDATLGLIRPVTRSTYDTLGRLTRVDAGYTPNPGTTPTADVVRLQQRYVYDDFGRILKESDALNRIWVFTYDVQGNVLTRTDAKGQRTTYTWAYGHQLRTRTEHTGAVTTWTRNPLGQVTQVQSPTVTYTYTYDAAHRLTGATDSRGPKTLSYTYSPGGLRNRLQASDGARTDYLYDADGQLTGIWAPGGDQVRFRYDAGGRLMERWFPTGLTTRYTYHPDHSLAQVVNRTATGAIVSQHDYTYDVLGNRLRHVERIGVGATPITYTYTYDALDRLLTVDNGTAAQKEAYTYDWLDNRTRRTVGAATPTVALYDTANQLTALRQGSATGALGAGFVYDANGSLTRKCEGGTVTTSATTCTGATVTALSYDVLNRLSQLSKTGVATQSYGYDPQARRIQKTVGTTATRYLYDGPDIVADYGTNYSIETTLTTHGPQWDDPIVHIVRTATRL